MNETTGNPQTEQADDGARQSLQNMQSQIVVDSEGLKFDAQIAQLFQKMRKGSGLSIEQLTQKLQIHSDILQALEKGDLNALPDWQQSSQAISRYAALLGIEPDPILRRLALHIQARASQSDVGSLQAGQSKTPANFPDKASPIYRPVETNQTAATVQPATQQPMTAMVAPLTEDHPLGAVPETKLDQSGSKRVEPTFSIQNSSPETLGDNSPSMHENDELGMFGKSQSQLSSNNVDNGGKATLRADRRNEMRNEAELVRPQMLDLLDEEKKGRKTSFLFLLTVLALAYIGWFAYTQPRLGKVLLEQLPFLSY